MEEKTADQELEERISSLPTAVQEAIASADIEAHLRELSKTHKLHLDQWELLENEVMMTLLGLERPENLADNIEKQVGMDHDPAVLLAADISRLVFEPIRSELESILSKNNSRDADITTLHPVPESTPYVVPTTTAKPAPLSPLPEAPTTQAVRVEVHPNYTEGASHERKEVAGDPYREQVK
jgi:hypothetical protein